MKTRGDEISLKGIPIAPGIILGNAYVVDIVFQKRSKSYKIRESEIPCEVGRIKEALQVLLLVNEYSEKVLQPDLASPALAILQFQKMLLEDKRFMNDIVEIIKTKRYRAETSVKITCERYKHHLLGSGSEYFQERISDIADLKKSFFDALLNPVALISGFTMKSQNAINRKKKTVAILKELIPRLVINQKIEGINAIVAERGGKTSHAAILCRAFGIPTVVGIKNIHLTVTNQSRILVDGISGKVVINPLEPTIYQIPTKSSLSSKPRKEAKESNKGFYIMANINFATEVIDAKKAHAGGIGLYRTEFEFMLAGRFLDEDEQFVRYKSIIKAMNGLPVYIRFLDLGRDKNVTDLIFTGESFLETNSYGAQFLLDNVEVFTVQAKAIARASQYGPVSVIYPMITGVNQFLFLRRLFKQKTKEITSGNIKHGVMLEVPSACLAAREILKFADFGHIGTNDLISILLGFKRDSKNDFTPQTVEHPMFWTLLTNVARAARSNDKSLMVCGELAKDYQFIKKIRKLKINCISVSPKCILSIRNTLNESHQLAEIR